MSCNQFVSNPPHYTFGGIETIDFIEAKLSEEQLEGYFVGNIIKYISRYQHKNGIEDLEKAMWYLNRLIQFKKDQEAIRDVLEKHEPF